MSEKIKEQKTKESIVEEIQVYLVDSFGNPTRIDYGTGHEMAFVMFLSSLFMIGALDREEDRYAHFGNFPDTTFWTPPPPKINCL